ncbi:glycosyltransferase EpsJ [Dysgonomonas alginatilytica]|uniref:Glycosyltransferase EpsJ n=1 Tax=Dysgonomonas alginatilytica TaxID=1605892 RepID=A0A2V3PUW8_9BACT|nr:glycosyltransferase [Dysgonomonas alginatilytica]PXV63318.1 glycosyltransferase EpsJ [Dysgonomonas alginatilytica]
MTPTISIIIPIYNMEQFLGRCLDSVVNQTYTALDIILINDGSTDSSGDICNAYAQNDPRINVIHQANGGVSSARNAGLDIATGDYISFVDPDDYIELNTYETLIPYLDNNSIDILRFNAYRKSEILNQLPFKGEYSGERFEQEIVLPMVGSEKFGGMFILGVLWIHLFRRKVIEKNHIRFNKELRRCEDRLFTITAMLHSNRMFFIDSVLYHYQVNDESLSNRYDPIRWQQELIFLDDLKKAYTHVKSDPFITEANKRIKNDYTLRAVTSINNEYFTNNTNSFFKRYKNIKTIINNPNTRLSIKDIQREKSGLKGDLIIGMIKYRLILLLNLFNTLILYKNKVING